MLTSVKGVYRDGRVELEETPAELTEAPVIVTFLTGNQSALAPPDLSPQEIADLRGKFKSWEEDWNAEGMEAYDG